MKNKRLKLKVIIILIALCFSVRYMYTAVTNPSMTTMELYLHTFNLDE